MVMAPLVLTKLLDPREKEDLIKVKKVPSMRVSTREMVPAEVAVVERTVIADPEEVTPRRSLRKRLRKKPQLKKKRRSLNPNTRRSLLVSISMSSSVTKNWLEVRRRPDKSRRSLLHPKRMTR